VKNVLVLAAPIAAGEFFEVEVVAAVAIAFLCFSLSASGIYLINDVLDVNEDRRHPVKRLRPVAAGELAPRTAVVAGVVLLVLAPALAAAASWELIVLLVAYELLSLAYGFRLKQEPVLDMAIVASGFLFRAMAGGLAAGIALSQWFLLVASFGALFMVAGKRYSELKLVSNEEGLSAGETRRSLQRYSASYLRFVWGMSASITVASYSLWAFEIRATDDAPWAAISIVPFVVGLLRYAVDIDSGQAGEPEDIILRDRVLQGLGLIWIVLLMVSVAS
jgi:decaprenyl-phosphate phosphoribosyltransferase